MPNLKYFVTGAAGFVGRHVCKLLIQSNSDVRALIRSEDNELNQLGVTLWIGDLWNRNLLQDAISDVDVVIHCAGDARFGNGSQYFRENVELTEHIIEVIRRHARTAHLVYISTIGATDRANSDRCIRPLTEDSPAFPTSDYGRSKLQAEDIVKKSGLSFSIVRPAMVVGDDMRAESHFAFFARQALTGSFFFRFRWTGRFSVIHVDDLANGILAVSTNKTAVGNTYFCAGESISIDEFLQQCKLSSLRFPLTQVSRFLKYFVRWMPFTLKAMLYPALTASDEKLRNLGWAPHYSAKEALKEVIHRERCRINPDLSPGGQTIITGAASGLGRALTLYLAPKRDKLLLIDQNALALDEISSQLKNCTTCVVDLANESEISALLASTKWQSTKITELYACAGIGFRGEMQSIQIQNHKKMFTVNIFSRIALAQNAMASMRRKHFGRVVLISSSSAFQPLPFMATYAATNSALLSLGEAWAAELSGDSVQIMTVCPGGMKTNFQKSSGVKEIDGERLMTPESVVLKIMSGLRKRQSTLIVSFRSLAMSLLARCLPRSLTVKLWFRLMGKMR
jgi:short-subunit dehydrogenase/uncharacterized protein YbjT (DUF2867 family)